MLFSLKYMTPATKNSKCILHYLLNGRLIIQNSSKLFFVLDNIIICTFIRKVVILAGKNVYIKSLYRDLNLAQGLL